MDRKEETFEYNNNKFMKKVLKSALYTFFIFILSMFGIYSIFGMIFTNMSVEQSYMWGVMSISIGIIFTIFFCTFTIIEEMKK